jgi:hypothetical protein
MGAIFKQIAVVRINCRCENEEWRLVALDICWLTNSAHKKQRHRLKGFRRWPFRDVGDSVLYHSLSKGHKRNEIQTKYSMVFRSILIPRVGKP